MNGHQLFGRDPRPGKRRKNPVPREVRDQAVRHMLKLAAAAGAEVAAFVLDMIGAAQQAAIREDPIARHGAGHEPPVCGDPIPACGETFDQHALQRVRHVEQGTYAVGVNVMKRNMRPWGDVA